MTHEEFEQYQLDNQSALADEMERIGIDPDEWDEMKEEMRRRRPRPMRRGEDAY